MAVLDNCRYRSLSPLPPLPPPPPHYPTTTCADAHLHGVLSAVPLLLRGYGFSTGSTLLHLPLLCDMCSVWRWRKCECVCVCVCVCVCECVCVTSLSPPSPHSQCIECTACVRWFHRACMSDHHSHPGGRGTWRCVACTHCVSCKTTTPGEVGCQLLARVVTTRHM